jgi:DNA primase
MEAKDEVRSRLAIEDVVGEYVQLKRAGRLWRGLSPFTSEKTPSFFVTPDKNIWHDFSSGRGGDIFSFIMEIEGLDFRGALEFLARKANVDLSKYNIGTRTNYDHKKRLLEANIWAKKYYQTALTQSKVAQDYVVKKRGLNKETVTEWGIGYAPENGGLNKFLLSKKYTEKELKSAGLMSSRGYDMFRDRMIIPLCDGQGQIVGFTGRIVNAGEPKYINTPATILYDKGRQVFGLHLAKEAIRKNNMAVLVEGNLDVISSHQVGVKNVVACAGTALTLDHLKSLSRLTDKVALGFDSDPAGVAATERAIILAQQLDINLYVIELPHDIKDPDELIQKDVSAWKEVIKKPKSAVEWIIDCHAMAVDLTTADGKKELTTAAAKVVSKLKDPVEAEHYLSTLARLTDTSLESLRKKISASGGSETKILKRPKVEKDKSIQRHNEQVLLNRILAIAYISKNLRSVLNNLPNEYLTEPLAKVKYYLLDENVEIDQDLSDKLAELELVASQIEGDKRTQMLSYMKELELIQTEKRRQKLNAEFASTNDDDDKKIEILSGAISGLNQTIKLLKKTGAGDEFDGLFEVWHSRKEDVVQ